MNFIATTANEKLYVQVTESMQSEDVRSRELAPLMKIQDNYEKIVLSLAPGLDSSYEGIKSLNLIEWLLREQAATDAHHTSSMMVTNIAFRKKHDLQKEVIKQK